MRCVYIGNNNTGDVFYFSNNNTGDVYICEYNLYVSNNNIAS